MSKKPSPDEAESEQEANDSARAALVRIFKNKYNGIMAQSRIASSYGLLQNLYTTAISEGFKDSLNNNPEKLNEPEGFKYNIYLYVTLFKKIKLQMRQIILFPVINIIIKKLKNYYLRPSLVMRVHTKLYCIYGIQL